MDYFLKLCCHPALFHCFRLRLASTCALEEHPFSYLQNGFIANSPPGNKIFFLPSSFPMLLYHVKMHEINEPGNDACFFNELYFQTGGGWWQMEDRRLQSSDQEVWSKHSWGRDNTGGLQGKGRRSGGRSLHLSPVSHFSYFFFFFLNKQSSSLTTEKPWAASLSSIATRVYWPWIHDVCGDYLS